MYKIVLPNFEGPFDLLLYFIKRDELNIYDIPISKISEEFLNYIKFMQYFDLELAGEFILMSATLMYIKAEMLLPRPKFDEDSEVEDPRTGLVQKLLEYKLYKDASKELAELQESQKYVFYRNLFESDASIIENSASYSNATLFDLINAYNKAVQKTEKTAPRHVVELENVTVEEKIEIINHLLEKEKRISFNNFISKSNKANIIVSFLAILELMKYQKIYIFQNENFDDIIIVNRNQVYREN